MEIKFSIKTRDFYFYLPKGHNVPGKIVLHWSLFAAEGVVGLVTRGEVCRMMRDYWTNYGGYTNYDERRLHKRDGLILGLLSLKD